MFVIEVIPLKRGVHIDSLTYFSSTAYERGTLLKIPVRNQNILGMVVGASEVSATKTALRAATFSLKKLPIQEKTQSLSTAYIKTAEDIALRNAASIGSVLYNLLPPDIRNGDVALPHTHHVTHTPKPVPEVFTASERERLLAYRSLVRETFVHSGSVLCVAPSTADAEMLFSHLSVGIATRTILLTSSMGKREIREAYAELDDFSKPKLIIATPSHAMIERHDITLVIIDHSRSPHYKEQVRPYIDYRDALITHAGYCGRRIISADLLPRSEEEYARRTETYHTYSEHQKRLHFSSKLTLVTMKDESDGTMPFRLFSPKTVEAIKSTLKERGHVFLFAARRGLAPVVACLDCGFIFRSPETGAPYSLVRAQKNGKEERWFVCSVSGKRERAKDTCEACGSWRLRERGIGIQYVYDEFSKLFPKTPVVLFDHTTASTHKKAVFLAQKFLNTKGTVMLGTHMAIPYLTKPIDLSVIVNADALFATPTWRLQEENLALMLRLREITRGTVFVQSRSKEESLIEHARHGTIGQFYTEELELRKTFNYPPFAVFVHLTWQGTREAVTSIREGMERLFKPFDISLYAAPSAPKGVFTEYGLIRVTASEWPNKKLVAALRELTPNIRIVINPDRIV